MNVLAIILVGLYIFFFSYKIPKIAFAKSIYISLFVKQWIAKLKTVIFHSHIHLHIHEITLEDTNNYQKRVIP